MNEPNYYGQLISQLYDLLDLRLEVGVYCPFMRDKNERYVVGTGGKEKL
ncbi:MULTISPECIES: hypothetical protein [Lysinibacillus]|nr:MULTISPECIES: hypothetical protein [Lysinibacillus]